MKRKILLTLSAMAIGVAAVGALTACDLFGGGDKGDRVDGTQGLSYSLTEDKLSYSVGLPRRTENDWDDADIVIPDSYKNKPVTEIEARGFENSGIQSVTMPDSMKLIGSSAFSGCEKLKTVTFGKGVTEIGNFAFSDTGLEGIEIPACVTKIGAQAFEDNFSLTAITVKGNAEIGNKAFESCYALKTAEFLGEENLTFGGSVFGRCKLESLTLNADTVTLDDTTFMDCKITRYAATRDTIYKSNFEGTLRTEFPSELVFLRTEEFPDEEIHSHKFGLPVSVTLPAALKRIGANVFCASGGLREVIFEGTVAQWCAIEFENEDSNPLNGGRARLIIDGSAVEGKLTIPAEAEKVNARAFYNYKGIRELEIEGATEIGDYAFYQNGIRELEIEGATEIGDYAFYQNDNLYSVALPEGLTSIGRCAFWDCALVEVTLPESLTDLGSQAFDHNYRLTRIINKSESLSDTLAHTWFHASKYFKIVTESDGSSVERIGDFVFWVDPNGSYYLMLYAGSRAATTLPADANGEKYVIHANAFRNSSLNEIAFADTTNWVCQSGNNQAVEIDVTDPAQNTENLKSTYQTYEWYQIND